MFVLEGTFKIRVQSLSVLVGKLRPREGKFHVDEWQSRDPSRVLPPPQPCLLPSLPPCLGVRDEAGCGDQSSPWRPRKDRALIQAHHLQAGDRGAAALLFL